jgi:glycosyltransferase involved in cell wall biosynthesis
MDRVRARAEMGLDTSKFYVLFPSTPRRVEKRYRLAEEAVSVARADVGDIDMLCLDNVPHEKVPIYMNAANLMLMTSSFEASPVTIREALSCNVPVISTDVGDAKEVLSGIDGCRIVSSDPGEIGKAVSTTLKNYTRVEGREKMMIYSLENTAAKLMKIYREIIRKKEKA